MRHAIRATLALSLPILFSLGACTKDSGSSSGGSSGGISGGSGAFRTQCGTVVGGALTNPASAGDGFRAPVKIVGANLISVSLPSGPLLVKLQSIGAPSNSSVAASARAALTSLANGGEGIFIPADENCSTTLAGGGTGALGQLFTLDGTSYSETLLARGLVGVTSDPCGGSLLTSCYRALEDEASKNFAGEIGRLLWKPVSDSNGKLAVHSAPSGTTVVVNGETGTNQGGGNGYGSLARFSKPGCAYGANARVQVFDRNGAAYTFNGSTTITIPNGCNRYCLDGSNLEQCVKR